MNNSYNSVLVSPNTLTEVIHLVVPARSGYSFTGLKCWANCDVTYTVYLNGSIITGGITSGALKDETAIFPTVWGLGAFDVVIVMAEQSESTNQTINATLYFEQL